MTLVEELKKRRRILLSILLYVVSFDLAYIFGVSRLYGYLGVSLNINWYKMGISTLVILCTILLLPTKMEKVSSHLFFILYVITYLPTASFFWLNDNSLIYFMELSFCFVLIEIFINRRSVKHPRVKVTRGNTILSLVFAIYILTTIALIVMNGGIKLQMIYFAIASQSREENISGFSGYLLNWCAKSLMPLFLAYFGYFRKKKWIIIVSLLQVGLYFSYGYKSFLLSVVYLLIVSYSIKAGWKFWKVLPSIFAGINIVSLLLYLLNIDRMFLFLFPFRTLALPSGGQFRYFEYFNTFDKLHFGGSFLGNLFGVKYQYSERIGNVISMYFHGRASNSNTGVFSYAYADFGFVGMILASLVLIIVFKVIDNTTQNTPKYMTVGALSYQIVCMNDTNLTINLMTGGVILSIIMLTVIDGIFYENDYNSPDIEAYPNNET